MGCTCDNTAGVIGCTIHKPLIVGQPINPRALDQYGYIQPGHEDRADIRCVAEMAARLWTSESGCDQHMNAVTDALVLFNLTREAMKEKP